MGSFADISDASSSILDLERIDVKEVAADVRSDPDMPAEPLAAISGKLPHPARSRDTLLAP